MTTGGTVGRSNVHKGDIYLVNLSNQIGSEQRGIRPAVIVQNNIGNVSSPTTIICPLTSKKKKMSATHVSLTPSDAGVMVDSTVLCEQVRVVDKGRLIKRLGQVNSIEKIDDINSKIMLSFGILS